MVGWYETSFVSYIKVQKKDVLAADTAQITVEPTYIIIISFGLTIFDGFIFGFVIYVMLL